MAAFTQATPVAPSRPIYMRITHMPAWGYLETFGEYMARCLVEGWWLWFIGAPEGDRLVVAAAQWVSAKKGGRAS
jgi:hypothetical protein